MGSARLAAARALLAVSQQGGYSNLVLDHVLEHEDLSTQDRSFCAALFYTTVQRLITLDYAIGGVSGKAITKLDPAVLSALRLGFCQLLFMPSVPQSAAVNESVTLAHQLGVGHASGFVNGVLRGFVRKGLAYPPPRDPLTALSVQHSVPMPLIGMWRKAYGHSTAVAILEGLEAPPPLFLRVNTLRTTAAQLAAQLAAEGVATHPVEGEPAALVAQGVAGGLTRLPAFVQGLFHVQDLSSQRCAAAGFVGGFTPARVLDVCAAPGGKSFTVAQLMGGQGALLSCDLYPARVSLIEQGAQRLGLSCIATRMADAAVYDPTLGEFDLVLCDVVCSGFGILRRKPEIRYKPLQTLDALPNLQYNILNVSAQYCRKGGRVVYSTCTLNPAENEAVVERLLREQPAFTLLGQPVTSLPGQDDADGFFYTVLEKQL